MASLKPRGTKRSSATSSYSSATSIVIFVGLSVLGLWLLTSNSFTPSQSSTPTTTTTATKTPTRITSIGHTHHSNALPQTRSNEENPSSISDAERSSDDKSDEAIVIEPEKKIENVETQADDGLKKEATLPDQVDHQDAKGSQENNDATEEEEKQAALETQTSEESSMTQKEEIIQENSHNETKVETNDGNHGAEDVSAEGGSLTRSSETTQNEISEEDQQKRIDEHQQQEDEQKQQGGQGRQSTDPNGATSHDQIQHDEATIHSQQDGSSSQEKDEPKAHATNQETKPDSLDKDTDKVTLSHKTNEVTSNKNDEVSNSNEDSNEMPTESTQSKNSWTTQANQSENQKERRNAVSNDKASSNHGYTWLLCNVTAGADYIPCLDNEKVISKIHNRSHHEHRERHCPEDPPTCLVPLTHHWQNIRDTRTG